MLTMEKLDNFFTKLEDLELIQFLQRHLFFKTCMKVLHTKIFYIGPDIYEI